MEADNQIAIYERNGNRKDLGRIVFSSKEMCDDLEKLGAIKNKSLILTFPSFEIVPENLISHFIRGYFDGDGCVWNGKRKKMIVKDSSRPTGFRERIIHNVKFQITGSISFITSLQEYLVKTLGFRKNKLAMRKKTEHQSDQICTMEYSGRKQMKRFFDFIYKDASIFMNRKYNKFLETLCVPNEKSLGSSELTAETPEMEISTQASTEEGSSTIPEMGVDSSESKDSAS